MTSDYTTAVAALVVLSVVLTAMVAFVISRPSDLSPSSR